MKRFVALFVLVCLFATAALSCGGKKEYSGSPTSGLPSASADADPTPTPEPSENPSATQEVSSTPETTVTPDAGDGTPDVLQLVLNTDGTFSNTMGDPQVVSYGDDKVISYDSEIGMNVAMIKGTRDVYTVDLKDWVSNLSEMYTVEVYFKLTEFRVDTAHLPIVSTAEGGGFAIELVHGETGVLQYVANLDGEYQKVTTTVELDKWYHMVGVWDGNYIILYVNGVKVGEYDSEYAFMSFPAAENAQFLTIGGDTHVYPDGTLGGPGAAFQLGICNLYSAALTEAQVQTAYQNLK